jgi:hypothetical protein
MKKSYLPIDLDLFFVMTCLVSMPTLSDNTGKFAGHALASKQIFDGKKLCVYFFMLLVNINELIEDKQSNFFLKNLSIEDTIVKPSEYIESRIRPLVGLSYIAILRAD